jgi:hypothetical protein
MAGEVKDEPKQGDTVTQPDDHAFPMGQPLVFAYKVRTECQRADGEAGCNQQEQASDDCARRWAMRNWFHSFVWETGANRGSRRINVALWFRRLKSREHDARPIYL